jgi:hypothetical protein
VLSLRRSEAGHRKRVETRGNACSRNAAGATVCANRVTRGHRSTCTRETVKNKHTRPPPQPSHDYGALLISITTAEGPKAAPKVRKCGGNMHMRGCVMLGAGGHMCMGRSHEWGTTVYAAGRAHVP